MVKFLSQHTGRGHKGSFFLCFFFPHIWKFQADRMSKTMNEVSGSFILHLIEVLVISIITFATRVLRFRSVLLCGWVSGHIWKCVTASNRIIKYKWWKYWALAQQYVILFPLSISKVLQFIWTYLHLLSAHILVSLPESLKHYYCENDSLLTLIGTLMPLFDQQIF